jgi:hypothetical protein
MRRSDDGTRRSRDRSGNAPLLFEDVFSGESLSSAVHGVVEQTFIGFLPVSEPEWQGGFG